MAVGRKSAPLEQTAALAHGSDGKILPYIVDVTDDEKVRSMIAEAEKKLGRSRFNSTTPELAAPTRRLSIFRSPSSTRS